MPQSGTLHPLAQRMVNHYLKLADLAPQARHPFDLRPSAPGLAHQRIPHLQLRARQLPHSPKGSPRLPLPFLKPVVTS